MEQSGFGPGNELAFEAMSSGWPRGLERLERSLRDGVILEMDK